MLLCSLSPSLNRELLHMRPQPTKLVVRTERIQLSVNRGCRDDSHKSRTLCSNECEMSHSTTRPARCYENRPRRCTRSIFWFWRLLSRSCWSEDLTQLHAVRKAALSYQTLRQISPQILDKNQPAPRRRRRSQLKKSGERGYGVPCGSQHQCAGLGECVRRRARSRPAKRSPYWV